MKKFDAISFLNGEINQNNCFHEVVFQSDLEIESNDFNHYYCPICGANLIKSIKSNFEDNRIIYMTNIFRTKDIHYMKGFITSLAYLNQNNKKFDLCKYFKKHKEEIQNELDNINNFIEDKHENKILLKK